MVALSRSMTLVPAPVLGVRRGLVIHNNQSLSDRCCSCLQVNVRPAKPGASPRRQPVSARKFPAGWSRSFSLAECRRNDASSLAVQVEVLRTEAAVVVEGLLRQRVTGESAPADSIFEGSMEDCRDVTDGAVGGRSQA